MQGIGITYSPPSSIFEEVIHSVSGSPMMRVRHIDRGPIQIGRVDAVRTSGSTIGVQIGPNQTVTTTNDVIGAEIRARSAVGAGAVIAVKGEPNCPSSTEGVTNARSFESNITVKGTRTVSGHICAVRTFLDVDSTVTVTGFKSVIQVATPNVSAWDYFANIEASSGVIGATTGATAAGTLKIRVAGVDKFIQLFGSAS